MKFLITGGGGLVGEHVCQELFSLGEVFVLEHPASSVKGKNVLPADITNFEELRDKFAGFDAVVHLAAVFSKSKQISRPSPQQLFEVNVKGTFNVLEACATNGIKKVVFASSICAFGNAPDRLPVREEHTPKPGGSGSELYGMTKFLGEGLCRGYTARYGISTLCLRLAPVKELTGAKEFITSVETLWSYVDVRDVAQAFRLACQAQGLSHEVFFVSASDTLSRIPNRRLIENDLPRIPRGCIEAEFLEQSFACFYSIDKAGKVLGYSPRYTWRD